MDSKPFSFSCFGSNNNWTEFAQVLLESEWIILQFHNIFINDNIMKFHELKYYEIEYICRLYTLDKRDLLQGFGPRGRGRETLNWLNWIKKKIYKLDNWIKKTY